MTSHQAKPRTSSDIEQVLPSQHHLSMTDQLEKQDIALVEDTKGGEDLVDEINSPAEILSRYPLLRDMSQSELDVLNKRVRRRMDIRLLPILTLCLIINYLDRSNVTNARIAGMQKDMHMNDVQWVSYEPASLHCEPFVTGFAFRFGNITQSMLTEPSLPESPSSTQDTWSLSFPDPSYCQSTGRESSSHS